MATTASGRRAMRSDARRNYARLLAEARSVFAERGADAPLEDIARRAGVGIGTLYRHFPTRTALQEAVYREDVERLSARGHELAGSRPPFEALAVWSREFVDYLAANRGLAKTLMDTYGKDSDVFRVCHNGIHGAAVDLLGRAQRTGEVRTDVDPTDVLRLINAVALAAERSPDGTEGTLCLMLDGLRYQA